MPTSPTLCVVIAARNAQATIARAIESALREERVSEVVVVDDGSDDATGRLAEEAGALVIHLPANLGIGGAVQTGYRYAEENGYRYAAQIDGDGQHNPADFERLLDTLRGSGADMVVGSRFLTGQGFQSTFARKIGIDLLAGLVSGLIGRKVTDPTSGYRICGRRAIELFAHDYPTDYPEVEALVLMDNSGLTFMETPVVMSARKTGKSSISALKSVYYMLKVTLAVLISKSRKSRGLSAQL